MFLASGKLRRRVQIQVPITIRGAQGTYSQGWAVLRTVYAHIENNNPTGRESPVAGKQRATQSFTITTRNMMERMQVTFRLVEGSYVYNVNSVILVEGIRHEMTWDVRENVTEFNDPDSNYDVVYDGDGNAITDNTGEYIGS